MLITKPRLDDFILEEVRPLRKPTIEPEWFTHTIQGSSNVFYLPKSKLDPNDGGQISFKNKVP